MIITPEDVIRQFHEDDAANATLTTGCPFCQGHFTIPRPGRHQFQYVVHTMPFCAAYDGLDPLEYLQASRKAKFGRTPEDGPVQ